MKDGISRPHETLVLTTHYMLYLLCRHKWPNVFYSRRVIPLINPLRTQKLPPSSFDRKMSDHQCIRPLRRVLIPLHAQELLLNSSSWVDQVPNFRQEIRQSHYRNDPVKYDLADITSTFTGLSIIKGRSFES